MIDFIAWLIFGAVVGGIAQFIVPGAQNLGWIKSILLGVGGAYAGGWLFSLAGMSSGEGLHYSGWVSSIVGAVVLLIAYVKLVAKK
ncbi:MAG: GlsB/YeaQ/YmgE family stress response membrane protein [Planctomycetota bacterium]